MKIPGIMIAAPASGSGKTAAACGLMAAFAQRGTQVQAFKCGPDYIDPMFHRTVLGVESGNLDLFFSTREELRELYARQGAGGELAITEGVMGYYDGTVFGRTEGSAWDVAVTLGIPAILVLPCRGMAASVLAMLKGFLTCREPANIRGILLNHISEGLYPRMKEMLMQGLAEMGVSGVEVVGFLPDSEDLRLESRHLGLVLPEEVPGLQEQMRRAGELVSRTVDLERILAIAREAKALPEPETVKADAEEAKLGRPEAAWQRQKAAGVRLAVARDQAFCFYYRENLKLLEELGLELVEFSPLRDAHLPEGISGVFFGGGYPELYARELSGNVSLLREIRERVGEGLPCLAECGGFQYLQTGLADPEGRLWPMADVIPSVSENRGRLVRFGYVTLKGVAEGAYLKPGETIRGHEFHHWDSTDCGASCLAVKPDGKRRWPCIHQTGNLFAGYPHLYYPSNPAFARRFVQTCRSYRNHKSC